MKLLLIFRFSNNSKGRKDNWHIPLVYILTTSRTRQDYDKIFDELLKLRPKLNPTDFTIDFEQAVIGSVKAHFPMAAVHGCYFHLMQNMWKHVQFVGLQTVYSEDAEFAFNIKLILALAYVPEADVLLAYEQLMETDFYSDEEGEHYEKIQQLVSYFRTTYLYDFERSGKRKNPRFPIPLWNIYENVLAGRWSFPSIS